MASVTTRRVVGHQIRLPEGRRSSRPHVATSPEVSAPVTAASSNVSLAKPIEWGPTVVPSTSEPPREWPSPSTTRRPYGRRSSPPPAMRVISALAPVVALCVSYILGTALAAALGLEPATVGAPVAVILFGTVLLFFSIGESRRRTTRQLVPSLRVRPETRRHSANNWGTRGGRAGSGGRERESHSIRRPSPDIGTPGTSHAPLGSSVSSESDAPDKGTRGSRRIRPGADAVARRLSLHPTVTLVGTVDDKGSGAVIDGLADLNSLCERHQVDRVVVAFSSSPSLECVERLRRLDPGVGISVVPRLFELVNWNSHIEEFNGMPLVHVPRPQLTLGGRTAKRAMDVVLAGATLALLSPLLLLVALFVKIDSAGPVFFRQPRTGRGGGTFSIVKFRTMRTSAESERAALLSRSETDGPNFKMRKDPRVTRVGQWLRRTSLDEVPQLLNVISGNMSLVGPRPFPVAEAAQISGWPVPRTEVRPGITGLWQISGRNDLSFEDLRQLDTAYIASWSIWLDVHVLLRTPSSVLRRSGAY